MYNMKSYKEFVNEKRKPILTKDATINKVYTIVYQYDGKEERDRLQYQGDDEFMSVGKRSNFAVGTIVYDKREGKWYGKSPGWDHIEDADLFIESVNEKKKDLPWDDDQMAEIMESILKIRQEISSIPKSGDKFYDKINDRLEKTATEAYERIKKLRAERHEVH